MVKYVLFSLSLLSMLIGLGDCGLNSGSCLFSIFMERFGLPPRLVLYCDDAATADNIGRTIDQCNTTTLKFDVFLDKSIVKARVSCLEKYMDSELIVTQSSGPAVYDVFQFSLADGVRHTSVISAELLSDNEDGRKLWTMNGLWMKTGGKVSIGLLLHLQQKEKINKFKTSWEKSLTFEPKKALRNKTTLVLLHESGLIETKSVDSTFAPSRRVEVSMKTEDGKVVEGFKWAMVLSDDYTQRLFKAGSDSFFEEIKFEAMYTPVAPHISRHISRLKGVNNGNDSVDGRSSCSRTSGSSRRSRRASCSLSPSRC